MHPAEFFHSYPVLQWPAAEVAPLDSWGSRQHGLISPLAKGPPQVFPIWSTPRSSGTAHVYKYTYCSMCLHMSLLPLLVNGMLIIFVPPTEHAVACLLFELSISPSIRLTEVIDSTARSFIVSLQIHMYVVYIDMHSWQFLDVPLTRNPWGSSHWLYHLVVYHQRALPGGC